MDTCVHMAESLCCSPETIIASLTSYTPIQNKKLKQQQQQQQQKKFSVVVNVSTTWASLRLRNHSQHQHCYLPPPSLLLLSCFSRVRLCVTPQIAAHQAPPSLGFSRQEHWSGLPLPSLHRPCSWTRANPSSNPSYFISPSPCRQIRLSPSLPGTPHIYFPVGLFP